MLFLLPIFKDMLQDETTYLFEQFTETITYFLR